MSCYFVAQIRIDYPDQYQKYLDDADEVFARYRGEYLAVDDEPELLEGSWSFKRCVLIRFPDEEEFQRWYRSPEYQVILPYRLSAAACTSLLVHGSRSVSLSA